MWNLWMNKAIIFPISPKIPKQDNKKTEGRPRFGSSSRVNHFNGEYLHPRCELNTHNHSHPQFKSWSEHSFLCTVLGSNLQDIWQLMIKVTIYSFTICNRFTQIPNQKHLSQIPYTQRNAHHEKNVYNKVSYLTMVSTFSFRSERFTWKSDLSTLFCSRSQHFTILSSPAEKRYGCRLLTARPLTALTWPVRDNFKVPLACRDKNML